MVTPASMNMDAMFRCDFKDAPAQLAHFWEHTVGSDHALMALRADCPCGTGANWGAVRRTDSRSLYSEGFIRRSLRSSRRLKTRLRKVSSLQKGPGRWK